MPTDKPEPSADPALPPELREQTDQGESRVSGSDAVGRQDLPHRNDGDSSPMIKRGGPFSCECAGLGCSRPGCQYF
jgi:hypothetical protein